MASSLFLNRFYNAWAQKYGQYSGFPEGEWDTWSMSVDEDVLSVKSHLDDPEDFSTELRSSDFSDTISK